MSKQSAWAAARAQAGTRLGNMLLAMLQAAVLCLPLIPAAAASGDTSGHWAESTISAWQQKGYISGYGDGSFRPNSSITRAEFIKILNRVLGLTAEGSVSFSDVQESDWF